MAWSGPAAARRDPLAVARRSLARQRREVRAVVDVEHEPPAGPQPLAHLPQHALVRRVVEVAEAVPQIGDAVEALVERVELAHVERAELGAARHGDPRAGDRVGVHVHAQHPVAARDQRAPRAGPARTPRRAAPGTRAGGSWRATNSTSAAVSSAPIGSRKIPIPLRRELVHFASVPRAVHAGRPLVSVFRPRTGSGTGARSWTRSSRTGG